MNVKRSFICLRVAATNFNGILYQPQHGKIVNDNNAPVEGATVYGSWSGAWTSVTDATGIQLNKERGNTSDSITLPPSDTP